MKGFVHIARDIAHIEKEFAHIESGIARIERGVVRIECIRDIAHIACQEQFHRFRQQRQAYLLKRFLQFQESKAQCQVLPKMKSIEFPQWVEFPRCPQLG